MTAIQLLAGLGLLGGAAFVAVAALGLVRLPDLYLRMHSVAKAGTLGCGLILVGVALALPDLGVVLRVLGAIVFLFVTAPVASHLIGRAAHRTGTPQWEGTVVDEWPEARTARPPTNPPAPDRAGGRSRDEAGGTNPGRS